MVQAKTSDFQPLPLKILNVLSLLAGASLLVAVSWEILLGDPRHYSTDYLLLQGIVCVVFLADFFARYEGENETYIEASAENSGSTLYDKEIRDKPRTRHTKRNV